MRCLLLTFDCLPRRWIGCYGSLDSTTRGFDRLAALGTTFDTAITANVASSAEEIAGFRVLQQNRRAQVFGAGVELSLPIEVITSADAPAASRKGRKRAASRLSHELHQASSWLRDQNRHCLAWVRHPGLHVPGAPLATPDDLSSLLAQLAVIDEELDAFLDEWLDCAEERWTLAITASRGVIRPRTVTRRRDERTPNDPAFTDDLIRVPLLVLEGRGEGFGRRRLGLLPTVRLAEAVRDSIAANDHALAGRLREAPPADALVIRGDNGRAAVRTADWLFVRSVEGDREAGEGQLFRKPEDACDVFDVRSEHTDVAIRLDSLIEA